MMIKGLLHFHSDFSYDGKDSIAHIAQWAKSEAIDFVVLTEHDNDFTPEKFERYVNECKKHSNDIIIVPGIEYSFGEHRHIHINVFGVAAFLETDNTLADLPRFLNLVKDKGGLAILNHPKSIVDEIAHVDLSGLFGVELWNTKNDFLYAPDPRAYRLIRDRLSDKTIFLTSDIHSIPKSSYAIIVSEEEGKRLKTIDDVIEFFRNGSFHCVFNTHVIANNLNQIKLNKSMLFLSGMHHKTYKGLRNLNKVLGFNISPKIVKMLKLR